MTTLAVPELSLVVLVGVTGSGKSTFARAHFKPTEVISSDFCRGLVADDENDQSATNDAFEVLNFIAGKRLSAGRLTVVDATNVQPESRKALVTLARAHDVLPVAIVLDVPESVCIERNAARADRDFGKHVVARQRQQLRRGLRGLKREGFRTVHVLDGVEAIGAVTGIERTRLYNDLRHESGPFDIIGDIHGCGGELQTLLSTLGYNVVLDERGRAVDASCPGRRVVFVGDLVDRGPDTAGVLRLAMGMVNSGNAFCVVGNHEDKLVRALRGRNVKVSHGLAESLAQLETETPEFRAAVESFLDGLISHYVFDGGQASWWRTPDSSNGCTAAPPAGSGLSACMAKPPARPTNTGFRCGIRGPTNTAAARWSSTDTRPRPNPSGSTTPSASTRAASSVGR